MAGQLTIDTLKASSGVLATQNGMTGICKAWVSFNGTGTVAIRGSFNVSSIVDNGTGYYTVNLTTAMPNVNYAVTAANEVGASVGCSVGINGGATFAAKTTPTTSSFTVNCYNPSGGGMVDSAYLNLAVFSA
jgi:hypothetical protein